jgi:uncharacterized protein (TIGR02453 family)
LDDSSFEIVRASSVAVVAERWAGYHPRMPKSFPGFSAKAITFLRQLEKNNSRGWFQPRKIDFDELVRLPMLELAGLINDQLRTFAVDHVMEPKKAVHRIYRDVRFSKDKAPYKTNISAMWHPRGLSKMSGGGYYLSISGKTVEIAGGVYMPGPAELTAIRKAIDTEPARFKKIVLDPKLLKLVGPLRGDQLSRPPKGFDPDHAAIDLLRQKQFYYFLTLPTSAATEPGLEKLAIKHFKAMHPAVEHLNNILRKISAPDEAADERPLRPKPMF